MKKILLILLGTVLLTAQVRASAGDNPPSPSGIAVIRVGTTFKVLYNGTKAGNVKVGIYDESGTLVFSETLRKIQSFIKPYNFSSLAEGIYTIEVTDGDRRQVEKVSYYSGHIERFMSLRQLKDDAGKFVLSVPGKENEVLTVRIFDDGNNLLYQQKENVSGDFAKVYKLNGAPGKVHFEVVIGNGIARYLSY